MTSDDFNDIIESIHDKSLAELKHIPKLFDRIITGVIYYHITHERLNISHADFIKLEDRIIEELGYEPKEPRF